ASITINTRQERVLPSTITFPLGQILCPLRTHLT
ncbi:MAG: hypothetical protein ACI9BK_001608, partial [Acidimicrobiales bacterium]